MLDQRQVVMAQGVTANGFASAVQIPSGNKSFYAEVVGTGPVAATVKIYGGIDASGANGILLATITLSGTNRHQDAAATSTAPWSFYYVEVSGLSGTGATVKVVGMY